MDSLRTKYFVQEWIEAWNRHDLEAILSHYAEEIAFTSPLIITLSKNSEGRLEGKAALRDYFQTALVQYPDLKFKLHHFSRGVQSLVLHYESVKGLQADEYMEIDPQGRIRRVVCHYREASSE